MDSDSPYSINLDEAFDPLQLVDVRTLADGVEDRWYNQTLCRVNDCVVRPGVMQGEFHWHHYDEEDEFFYAIEGKFLIDLEEDRTIELAPRQESMVPKGVVHRTWAPERTAILMTDPHR